MRKGNLFFLSNKNAASERVKAQLDTTTKALAQLGGKGKDVHSLNF